MDILKVILKKGEEKRIKQGDPWVYSNEVLSFEGKIKSGELCDVYSFQNEFIGRGFFNSASKIIVRIISYEKIIVDINFFIDRITKAYEYRKQLGFTNNCRVVFGEADLLPGLIVDKYGEYLSIQILCLCMDINRELIKEALIKIFNPKGIMERSDVKVRLKEGLEEVKNFLYPAKFDPKVIIEENGIKLKVDLENGQKTGYFLDQKINRLTLKQYVKDKTVLDCFSHTGAFALNAINFGAKFATAVDISEKACNDILENAKLNHFENKIDVKCCDAFAFLRDESNKNKYDVIVLDPPAFTKSKETIEKAYNGYKEINMSALKLLNENGILITFSCSQHMKPSLFIQMLTDAANDVKKIVQMVDFRIQAPDHPTRLGSDDSLYLKCVVLRVL